MQFFKLPWGRMAYDDMTTGGTANSNVPLLLLPGTGCDTPDWAPFIAALPRGRRVISIDFRGHGQSDTPERGYGFADMEDDVIKLAEHLRLPRFFIAGHSMGGMVGMLAAARSEAVAGVISLEGWVDSSASDAFAPEHTMGLMDNDTVAEVERKLTQTQSRFKPEVWAALCASGGSFDAKAYLARATTPVLHVYGDYGRYDNCQERMRIPANPRSRFAWVAACGHYLPHEKPRESAQLTSEAMAEWE